MKSCERRARQWAGLILLAVLARPPWVAADDLQKTQKKELEAAAKALIGEAKSLESSGKLVEARLKYAESLGTLELNDAVQAVDRLNKELHNRAKGAIQTAKKFYDAEKFREAAQALENAQQLQTSQPLLSYNLALCYKQLGEHQKATDYLDEAIAGASTPKLRSRLAQMRTVFTTSETPTTLNDNTKKQIGAFDHLAETVGNGSSVEDELGDEESSVEGEQPPNPSSVSATVQARVPAPTPSRNSTAVNFTPTDKPQGGKGGRFSSACTALQTVKAATAASAGAIFNLANCAEHNNRPDEATRLLRRYLELSPKALDAARVTQRISELEILRGLPNQTGSQVRSLYASANRSTEERQYDRALADFTKAADLAPDFALTRWKLGLLQEAFGNVAQARKHYTRYRELDNDTATQGRADFHLDMLDAKKEAYDAEVSDAEDAISDLLNRAMNLTFNGLENRSAVRAHRGRRKGHDVDKNRAKMLGGFTVPLPYAHQQFALASQHLAAALAIFPLGAEANELMALIYLQALDGRAAIRSYDAVASQNLPVSFYVEIRGRHNFDRPAKCELSRDRIRLIYLASYDKKGFPKPPARQVGDDGLGDLVIEPVVSRATDFEEMAIGLADIKKIETKNGQIYLKLQHEEYALSPLALAFYPPTQGGPFARRFSNDYTRLFVRYPGLEDSKLGAEGLTGYEKFQFGMNLASAAMDAAMGGVGAIGIIQDIQSVAKVVRMLQKTMNSFKINYGAWETSVNEQQAVLVGNPFKPIPTEPLRLDYVQELK
jgi:tetratricopeptide (TPR) repeat protein